MPPTPKKWFPWFVLFMLFIFLFVFSECNWNLCFYIWTSGRDDCGMVQDIFRNHFGLGISLKIQFWIPKLIFRFFENLNFQFSSTSHFLSHEFEDPSCRICSYGPRGPFWFSVNFHLDMDKYYQRNENGEKSCFEIIVNMKLFSGGLFWKAPLC